MTYLWLIGVAPCLDPEPREGGDLAALPLNRPGSGLELAQTRGTEGSLSAEERREGRCGGVSGCPVPPPRSGSSSHHLCPTPQDLGNLPQEERGNVAGGFPELLCTVLTGRSQGGSEMGGQTLPAV